MTAQHPAARQQGAITLLVAIGLVILASLTSFYSSRSVLMDQLATHNHARASQAREAAEAALAGAQDQFMAAGDGFQSLFSTLSDCPPGVTGPQWQCARINLAQHPSLPEARLSAMAVRDLVMAPHSVTLHASASLPGQHSQAQVRESLFVPFLPPAPNLAAPAALVLNGCITEALAATLRVCPLNNKSTPCTGTAKAPSVQTHFAVDTNRNGSISSAEKNACLALSGNSLPGGGSKTAPATALARSPCNRAAWRSVLGEITDQQIQDWSAAQERNGLDAHSSPPRTIYWVDSPGDWEQSVGTASYPALLVFSAQACAERCPRMGLSTRTIGSVVLNSGCNDDKMRSWQSGTIEGQLVVESGLPEWRSGTVLAQPEGRDAYILNWPAGIDPRPMQRVNGSWHEGAP